MTLKQKTKAKIYLRPPVVAVLGHVDHGKTTLLSAIREKDLTLKEHGGITQHIGAYQIVYKGEKITFIDTPGHAAFIKMRSYGVAVTDVVILVVAANDGVKPQTKESIAHIREAKVPFLVAVNKIDLPQTSLDKVKAQLAENEVLVEGYGGDVVCLPISAKQKKGLDELLEMTLLLAKMQNLKAQPKGPLSGVVIDSKLDVQKGPLATILVKNGTLHTGDQIVTPSASGKVRWMFNEIGKRVDFALPSDAVAVLGFKKIPPIGAKVTVRVSGQETPVAIELTRQRNIVKENGEEEEKINIILKADTSGTLEAIQQSIAQEVTIVMAGVGQVSESDVLLALSTGAKILAFNVVTPASVKKLAETEKINIKTYSVIYELLEDLEKKVLSIMEPTINEDILGEAEVIAEFKIKGSHIAGCKIKKGKITKKDKVHLKRQDKIIANCRIKSFQKEKQEISEAKAGSEVGIVMQPDVDFTLGDVIIAYSEK